MLRALKRTAARLSPRRMSGRYPPPVHGTLREDLGMPFIGVVRTSRHGLRWRRSWSLREQEVGWNHVRSCAVAPDRRLGVPRHSPGQAAIYLTLHQTIDPMATCPETAVRPPCNPSFVKGIVRPQGCQSESSTKPEAAPPSASNSCVIERCAHDWFG